MCYHPIINLVNGPNMWPSTSYDDVLPPPFRKPIGRPKKRRRKEHDEQTPAKKLTPRRRRAKKAEQPKHSKASQPT
ncbi:hypothetical protein G2W53_037234 [Senna tora]|uniref:Uncharacterized protein n=1 Tax=Senna tora TaxID=362788 RepID=A0A834SVG0_9FABA|nr:hypothetical protein G2W53_037234 [Senna tora]